jgi:hypothetical protein
MSRRYDSAGIQRFSQPETLVPRSDATGKVGGRMPRSRANNRKSKAWSLSNFPRSRKPEMAQRTVGHMAAPLPKGFMSRLRKSFCQRAQSR